MKKININQLQGKDISEVISFADSLFKEDLEGKINAHYIYKTCLEQIPNNYSYPNTRIRGMVRQKIWNTEKYFNWNQDFFSQSGQDKCVKNFFFKNLKNGFFVEIGAYDGIKGSNCFFFEKFMNWKGIAVEASPLNFKKLTQNRNCVCINKAISNNIEKKEFIEVISGYTGMSGIKTEEYKKTLNIINKDSRSKINKLIVETSTFKDIVNKNTVIDYLSIDIEGDEMKVLESIDFNYFDIKVVSVENNNSEKKIYFNFFKDREFNYFDNYGVDEIYYNNKYFNNL